MFDNKIINFFFNSNFIFKLPKKSQIVFYKKRSYSSLIDSLSTKKIQYLDCLENCQKVYVVLLIKSLLHFVFKNQVKLKLYAGIKIYYYYYYFKITNPNIIISATENDPLFYFLKKFYPNGNFIVLQNGKKNHHYFINIIESFKKNNCLDKPNIDYFFCFGDLLKFKLKNYFSKRVKIISHGSITNNDFKILRNKKNIKRIGIISEFVDIDPITKLDVFNKPIELLNNTTVSRNDYYLPERISLPIILKFCKKNNLKIMIITRSNFNDKNKNSEKFFFKKCLSQIKNIKNDNIEFSCDKKLSIKEKYNLTDKNILNIGFGTSSMDLEILSRGNKFCFLSLRGKIIKKKHNKDYAYWFWPKKINKKNFLTEDSSKEGKILNFLEKMFKIDKKNYINQLNKIKIDDFIKYNSQNLILKKSIINILNHK